MKKTLLTLSVLGAFVSGSAMAAFADAGNTSASGAGAKLTFSGNISTSTYNWMWEIPDGIVAAAKDIVLNKKNDGVVSGSDTSFTLSKVADEVLLQGYMKNPLTGSMMNVVPDVKFGSHNQVDSDTVSQGIDFKVLSNGKEVGTLDLVIQSQVAMVGKWKGVDTDGWLTTGNTNSDDVKKLAYSIPGFNTKYPAVKEYLQSIDNNFLNHAMTRTDYTEKTGFKLIKLKSAKLSFPTNSIPDSWSVSVPVTISMK